MKMIFPSEFNGDYYLFVVKIMWIYCALLVRKSRESGGNVGLNNHLQLKRPVHCNSQFEAGKKLTKLFTKINKLLKQPEQKSEKLV